MDPLVSVCVPAFNMERYIGEALESIACQTYTNFEVWVIDDGSTDGTADVMRPFLSDARFRYKYQDNAGLGAARQAALELSTGEWFALLDADDLWLPDKLERQMALAASDSRINLIYGDVYISYDDGRPEHRYFSDIAMREGDITDWLYERNYIPCPSAVVRIEELKRIGGFSLRRRCEDGETWQKLALHGVWAKGCSEPVARYRVRGDSLSTNTILMLETAIEVREIGLSMEKRPCLAKILRRTIRRLKGDLAFAHAKQAAGNDSAEFERSIWEMWRQHPAHWKTFLRALQCSVSRLTHLDMGVRSYVEKIKSLY